MFNTVRSILLVGASPILLILFQNATPIDSSPRSSNEGTFIGKQMVFNQKYRVTRPNGQVFEYSRIGSHEFHSDGTGKIQYSLYVSNANVPPTRSHHNVNKMNAIYGGIATPSCTGIPMWEMSPQIESEVMATTWSVSGEFLEIKVGEVIHYWKITDLANGELRLNRNPVNSGSGENLIKGNLYTDALGFAYLTSNAHQADPISIDQNFHMAYAGDYYQNNRSSADAWVYGVTSLNLSIFKTDSDQDMLSASNPCDFGMWCQTDILLNSKNNKYEYAIHNGHDYNKNGCHDETNHTLRAWAISDGSDKINKIIFLEYSWERDGYPIVSIGRYYRKKANDPQLSIDLPRKNSAHQKGQSLEINWELARGQYQPGDRVAIILRNGPFVMAEVASDLDAQNRTFLWKIPNSLSASGSRYMSARNYFFQVRLIRGGFPVTSRNSDVFTIAED